MSKLKKDAMVKCYGCDHKWRPRKGGRVARPDKVNYTPRKRRCPQCGKWVNP